MSNVTKDKLKVFTIGSCRAFGLARRLCYNNKTFMNLNSDGRFTHTTKDALYFFDDKIKTIPKELKNEFHFYNLEMISRLDNSDLIIIEVSSRKSLAYKGHDINFYYSNLANKKRFLKKLRLSDMKNDMAIIKEKANAKVIFMTHINILDKDGIPIVNNRSSFVNDVLLITNELNLHCFQPGNYLPSTNYLRYVDKVAYHYTDKGLKHVGRHFTRFVEDIMIKEDEKVND